MKVRHFIFTLAYMAMLANPTFPSRAAEGQRIALVIGNGNYRAMEQLANPGNDATLIAERLTRLGFRVILLLDLDRHAMLRAFGEFSQQIKTLSRDATALVYFAGHGVEVGSVNYLIPIDAEISSETEVPHGALSVNELMQLVAGAGSAVNIFVLDACRNDPFRRGPSRSVSQRGLTWMGPVRGFYIASSTAAGDVASDGPGGNSPYTLALADALMVPGQKLEDVFKRVRRLMRKSIGDRQIPWESSSLESDFYFVPSSKQPAADEPPLDEPDLVKSIQIELARLGCRSGPPSAKFDRATVVGLRSFALMTDDKFHWHRPTVAALRALRKGRGGETCAPNLAASTPCFAVNGEKFCE